MSRWSEPAAHDELFRLVHAHDAWVWAARRYRDYQTTHAGDPVAARQLRRLQGFLMVALAPRIKSARNPYRATVSVLVMLVIALGVGTVFTRLGFSSLGARDSWETGVEVTALPDPDPAPVADHTPIAPSATSVVATTR